MTVEASVEAALFGRVRDLSMFGADAKAWPNIPFDPTTTEPHLRIALLPNFGERLFVKGSDPSLYRGILQLTVVMPLNAGPAAATELAGEVAAEFPADLAIYGDQIKVRIERAPDVASPVRADATWQVPVSVRYECIASA
jgi:hypothetical protein